VTATEFRQQLYQVLGRIAESGTGVTITHRGRTFSIVPEAKPVLMERLVPHDTLMVSPDELVAAESPPWEWHEERNLDGIS
jgi:antitoxin (DNA-binding transcriptional repressor) of toxin-antitoxin stability system